MLTVDRALAWLASSATDPDGRVLSWRRNGDPGSGHPYPEASAIYLHQLTLDLGSTQPADGTVDKGLLARIEQALLADYQREGGIGKAGKLYAFDAGVALAALHATGRQQGVCEEIANDLANWLHRRRASSGWPEDAPPRWSRHFGPHLLKSCARLQRSAPQYEELARERFAELERLRNGGRFLTCGEGEPTYLHAQMYAMEGVLLWPNSSDDSLIESLDWVASIQCESGSICAWHDGLLASGPERLDATAQALRLWSAVDADRYEPNRRAAEGFLLGQQHESGAFPYEPGSEDLNSWCTLFAVQALRWNDAVNSGRSIDIDSMT